jgi:conserved domain protein
MVAKTPLSNKELLMEAIESSSSIKECLTRLGLRPSGCVYKSFHKWCEVHGIDESPLDKRRIEEARTRSSLKRKYSDEEVFVKNSPYTDSVRHRMLKVGFEYKCDSCGIKDSWNGKPLTLQVEHKNGVHTDNRIENLCFLCPNCHSQTSTYGSKNINYRSVNKCRDCGKQTVNGKHRCEECCSVKSLNKKRRDKASLKRLGSILASKDYKVDRTLIVLLLRAYETIEDASKVISMTTEDFKKKCDEFGIPTSGNELALFITHAKADASRDPGKEELIKAFVENNLVFVRVSKLYGVSDNAIRKWCKKHGIPTNKKELVRYMQEVPMAGIEPAMTSL